MFILETISKLAYNATGYMNISILFKLNCNKQFQYQNIKFWFIHKKNKFLNRNTKRKAHSMTLVLSLFAQFWLCHASTCSWPQVQASPGTYAGSQVNKIGITCITTPHGMTATDLEGSQSAVFLKCDTSLILLGPFHDSNLSLFGRFWLHRASTCSPP